MSRASTSAESGVRKAGVAAAAVEWQDAQGSPIRLPWPYGVTSHKSGNTLTVPDLIPEVTRIVVSVPGFEPINVPFTFSPGERSKLQAALTRVP